MMRLFIAEKPELARAIVEALGGGKKENGCYLCGSDVVTWCFGHMLELLEPGEYDARYEKWSLEDLPFSFVPWRKKPIARGETQFKRILMLLKDADRVVHAGDPDAEGQLLVDEILAYASCTKPVQRILINDNTPAAVQKSLQTLQDNAIFAGLSAAAEARQIGDQLYGFNMTRLYTLKARHQGYTGGTLSVGRVQTPVLGLVVRRDRENAGHKKAFFYTVTGQFQVGDQCFPAVYVPAANRSPVVSDTVDEKNRLLDPAQAQAIADTAAKVAAVILNAKTEIKALPAPLPYNLLKLQTDAARLHRMKPDYVKDITQTLREKHRLITYNRSDCQYLPEDHHANASTVLAVIAQTCPDLREAASKSDPAIKGRAFDSSKITAHHAIVPTASAADFDHLSKDEQIIYTLIARAYIAQFYPPYEYEQTIVRVQVAGREFLCRTHVAQNPGWKVLFQRDENTKEEEASGEEQNEVCQSLRDLRVDQSGICSAAAVAKGETKPKALYTLATLLTDLTRVAQYIRDERLRKLLIQKDQDKAGEHGGIGTPATRDAVISTLFERGFLVEQRYGKALQVVSTDAGRDFYDTLPDQAKFPDMTALWHEQQIEIERGEREIGQFVQELGAYITNEVGRVKRDGLDLKTTFHACPTCGKAMLQRTGAKGAFWGCSGYPDCRKTLQDSDGKPGEDVPLEIPANAPACPACGKPMRLLRKAGKEFYGCSGFPECRVTLSAQEGKVKQKTPTSELHQCLDCGKGLVRRKSKNGTDYWWGCSGYPTCRACYMDLDGKPDYNPKPATTK